MFIFKGTCNSNVCVVNYTTVKNQSKSQWHVLNCLEKENIRSKTQVGGVLLEN